MQWILQEEWILREEGGDPPAMSTAVIHYMLFIHKEKKQDLEQRGTMT